MEVWIVVIVTSAWVLFDTKKLGVKKGQLKGLGDVAPWGWFFACLLLWIVAFPYYLIKRPQLKAINAAGADAAGE